MKPFKVTIEFEVDVTEEAENDLEYDLKFARSDYRKEIKQAAGWLEGSAVVSFKDTGNGKVSNFRSEVK